MSYKSKFTGLEVEDAIGKARTALQKHQDLKTINGQSIVGTGDIEILKKVIIISSQNAISLTNGAVCIATFLATGNLNVSLNKNGVTDFGNYTFIFITGSNPPSLTLDGNVMWANGTIPTIEANTIYELSINVISVSSGSEYVNAVLVPFKSV